MGGSNDGSDDGSDDDKYDKYDNDVIVIGVHIHVEYGKERLQASRDDGSLPKHCDQPL
jgi:hypothetical protein